MERRRDGMADFKDAKSAKQVPAQRAAELRRTNGWGIDLAYQDAFDEWHDVSEETVRAVLNAMGADAAVGHSKPETVPLFARVGEGQPVDRPATIRLETGEVIHAARNLPLDLPTGYHSIEFANAEEPRRLIVSPGKCHLPRDLSTWGWAVQLYSARSRESWGIGDFGDLERLAEWSGEKLGAGMLLLNPLSAASPVKPQQTSPYYPTSRRFFNPLWIHVEWIPGALPRDRKAVELAAQAGQRLNRERLIDRDRVFDLKMRAFELLWANFAGDPSFTVFCREQGADLDRYAAFCALAEHYNSGWRSWPPEYRHPASAAVARFAADNRRRVDFHKWLQWTFDRQLARCSKHVALMQDLPIGVDPDGADAWAWQDVFAKGTGVGAPPDEFNTQGQNWGLPPFVPHKLREAGYEPFIQTIRAAFRNGGGLRIDHVMGLFRLFWIPQGMSAKDGAYVRYNADEMLAIVALESARARAYVVGEDLGTVEDEVREKLADCDILSYRLLWFEKESCDTYPREALAAITTHDLPTVAGLWTGSDIARQHELELNPNEESTAEIRERLARVAALSPGDSLEQVVAQAYRVLAQAPCRILTAALDDAALVEERPNMPATTRDQNPNWSLALPLPIEDLIEQPLPLRIASALRRTVRATDG